MTTLRSDAADWLIGRHRAITWPLAFLHLVAESERMAGRELDRLEAAAARGRGSPPGSTVGQGCPMRSRRCCAPVLAPKALAARLKVTPQTATAVLRELQRKGVVSEVTGRGEVRALAI
jgi:hypothetical protein